MNDKMSAAEQDKIWLLQQIPDVTENEIDEFVERVSICWADAGLDEETAREVSKNRILIKRGD